MKPWEIWPACHQTIILQFSKLILRISVNNSWTCLSLSTSPWWSMGPCKHMGSFKQKQGLLPCSNGEGQALCYARCVQLILQVWVQWGSSGHLLVQVFFCACPVEAESHGCVYLKEGVSAGVGCFFVLVLSILQPTAVLSWLPAGSQPARAPIPCHWFWHCPYWLFSTFLPRDGWRSCVSVKIFEHWASVDCICHQAPKYTHGPGHNSLNLFTEGNILEYCVIRLTVKQIHAPPENTTCHSTIRSGKTMQTSHIYVISQVYIPDTFYFKKKTEN